MKFLCVGYYDQKKMDALSKARVDEVMSECPPFMEELYDSGKVLLVAGTESEAKSMRRVGGKVEISDGSGRGGQETVGCVFLVEAPNIAAAIRVASLHPTTRIGAGEKLGWRIGISRVHYFEERRPKK
jgi:hypothetical protein